MFAHGQSDCLRVVSRGASNRIPWRRPKVAAQQHGEDEAGCALELCEGDRDDDEECDAVGLFDDPLVAELEKVLDADDDAHDSSESEESEAEALAEPESLGPEPPTYASVCAGLGLEERGRELFLLGDSAPIGRMEVCCGAMQSLKAVCGRHPKCALFMSASSQYYPKVASCMEWLKDGVALSAADHQAAAVAVKTSYGIKARRASAAASSSSAAAAAAP